MRIVDLRDLDPSGEAVFGGKACGLARLIETGARVPTGFAIEATVSPPDEWPEADRAELRRRAERLTEGGPVAVRSSAVGEDSAERSFAGMFETVLGVAEAERVESAVGRCIHSGRSERVLAYAGSTAPLSVGVVVQKLVAARAAGVCFTVDPAGKDRAILIEAVAGTGDALVSGRAQPERWRVYRTGLGTWDARRDPRGARGVLAHSEVVEIVLQASNRAERFGRPLDLEWAIDGDGSLFWLQARPITAAVPPLDFVVQRYFDGVDDGPITVWANWNVREVMPDPFEPFEWTLWCNVILPSVAEPMFGVSRSSPLFRHIVSLDLVHGRIYWNMNALLAGPAGRLFVPLLGVIDARAGEVTSRLVAEGVLGPRRLPGSRAALLLKVLWASMRSVTGVLSALRPRLVLEGLKACAEEIRRRGDVGPLSDDELLRELQLVDSPVTDRLRKGQQAMAAGFFAYAVAERAFRRHPAARRLLAAGIPGNPTTEISLGIDHLVASARPVADAFREALPAPELLGRIEAAPGGAAWLAKLRDFLDRYGQRCPSEFDLGAPRWAEDPSMILDLVRAGLLSPPSETVAERLARLARERREAVGAAVAASPLWMGPLLRLLARAVELYMPLREAPKHYGMFAFQRMRQAALELGSRLVARGVIDARDDVFFLEWREVQALVGGGGTEKDPRPFVEQRRKLFERFRRERAPDFLRSDGVPVVEEAADVGSTEGVLRGTGASCGFASGPVRVLREPDPKAMSDGDAIVVEFADPGWTPLFPRACAVVMEVGGAMCHAAVIARELGIPAVFGVTGATAILKDGQRVRVDGDLGTVTLE